MLTVASHPLAEPACSIFAVPDRAELREELGGAALSHLLAARPLDRRIGCHEEDGFPVAPLRREALEKRVGVGGESHGEGADVALRARSVEHDDSTGSANGHEAGEDVDELVSISETSRVKQVRAVEQVQRWLRQSQPPVEVDSRRCRRASKSATAAATETLSELT